jgi:hypothetical protein
LAPNGALVSRAIGGQLPIALGVEHAARGVELVNRALQQLERSSSSIPFIRPSSI